MDTFGSMVGLGIGLMGAKMVIDKLSEKPKRRKKQVQNRNNRFSIGAI